MELVPLGIFSKDLKSNTNLIKVLRKSEEDCFGFDSTKTNFDANGYINIGDKYKNTSYVLFVLIFEKSVSIEFDNLIPDVGDKIKFLETGINPLNGQYVDISSLILGHSIVIYENTRNVAGIYNVCKHASAKQKNIPNFGKKMFESILESCRTNIAHGTLLWLGIDIKNPIIDKIVNIYTSFGFSNPYANKTDLFENEVNGTPFILCLTCKNTYIDPDDIDQNTVIVELKYCIQQAYRLFEGDIGRNIENMSNIITVSNYERQIGIKNCCGVAIIFDRDYGQYLRRLLSITSNLVEKNNNWELVPAEVSGSLDIVNPVINNEGYFIWTVTDDTETEGKIGEEEFTVLNVDNNFVGSFHTHPTSYLTNSPFGIKLDYGPPSVPDYTVFISRAIEGEMFSCTVTPEGIYVFCLNPEYSRYQLLAELKIAMYKYGYDKYSKYIGQDGLNPTGVYGSLLKLPGATACRRLTYEFNTPEKAGLEFARQVELIPAFPNDNKFPPIVKCQLILWDQVDKKVPIYISYPHMFNKICTPNKQTKENINIIYGYDRKKAGFARFDRKTAKIKKLQSQINECNQNLRYIRASKGVQI